MYSISRNSSLYWTYRIRQTGKWSRPGTDIKVMGVPD